MGARGEDHRRLPLHHVCIPACAIRCCCSVDTRRSVVTHAMSMAERCVQTRTNSCITICVFFSDKKSHSMPQRVCLLICSLFLKNKFGGFIFLLRSINISCVLCVLKYTASNGSNGQLLPFPCPLPHPPKTIRKKTESDSAEIDPEGESEDDSEDDSDGPPPPLVSSSGSEAETGPPKGATKTTRARSSTKPKAAASTAGDGKSRMVRGRYLEAFCLCVCGEGGTRSIQMILSIVIL